jgi:O-acetyl-ADP-ribose deacetylase (regulator of RNase III)
MIRYLKGDATRPAGHGPKVIVHCCNDRGAWGSGFVLALSNRWDTSRDRSPEGAYRAWYRAKAFPQILCQPGNPQVEVEGLTRMVPFQLGQAQFVEVEQQLWVCNLIGQHGTGMVDGQPPIRYEAIQQGLGYVRAFCQAVGAKVACPRFGAGLAGGDWNLIAKLLEQEVVAAGIGVDCYDL